jgi:hypothetical protein
MHVRSTKKVAGPTVAMASLSPSSRLSQNSDIPLPPKPGADTHRGIDFSGSHLHLVCIAGHLVCIPGHLEISAIVGS